MSRKALSKKTRFEVFKRDSFTCQYCGAAAPDVVLHVDHINPVAVGGDNDIMNLITACAGCNGGKGARPLSDNSAITKQKAQLDELNKRREQLEMLLSWREALSSLDKDYVSAVENRFQEVTGLGFSDYGRRNIEKYLKRFTLADLLDALEGALDTYYKGGSDDEEANHQLARRALEMLPRVANAKRLNEQKPWMKDLFYIRAIIRNRHYCNDRTALDLLERAYHAGADLAELQDWAKRARNWTNWRNEMDKWIEELETAE